MYIVQPDQINMAMLFWYLVPEYNKIISEIFFMIRAESLNSVTNSAVADTDGVEVQIDM